MLNAHGPFCLRGDSEEEERQAQLRELVERLVSQREAEDAAGGGGSTRAGVGKKLAGVDEGDESSDFDD